MFAMFIWIYRAVSENPIGDFIFARDVNPFYIHLL